VAEACHRRGLKIPTDVALVGAHNEPLICANPEPTLSSIEFGFERIGYRAAELLDSLLDGAAPPAEPIRIAPVELIVRQSTDAFAVDHPVVMSALSFIAKQAHTAISVDEVADHAATTRRTLARLFQRNLGESVHQTITNVRLERVKRELIETDETLKFIAHRCGFRDAVHLCKVFQREEDCSPSEFREARRRRPA
jgi:LacI family transcriptional regulator